MTILYPDRFNQARPAGFDGTFDWDFLLPAFNGTKIKFMDWDGVVERNHRFLVFETKERGKEIPDGQRICLEAAVRLGRFTVIAIAGKNEADIDGFDIWFLTDKGKLVKRHVDGGPKKLLEITHRWFRNASKLYISEADRLALSTCQTCGQQIDGWEIY